MSWARNNQIETLEDLHAHLQLAIGLEWATIPTYLAGLYSIPEGSNTAASRLIQSVVIEEMLHMALAANVLNAVGGEPNPGPVFVPMLGEEVSPVPTFPGSPPLLPALELHLHRFSPEALELYLTIEHPANPVHHGGVGYESIGEFYAAIIRALRNPDICSDGLFEHFAHERLHCQIKPEEFYGGAGNLIVVTGRDSAIQAIEEIVEQGEGMPPKRWGHTPAKGGVKPSYAPASAGKGIPVEDGDVLADGWLMYSHYARFKEIQAGRRYQPDQVLSEEPQGSVVPVDWNAVYPMATDPTDPDKDYSGTEVEAAVDAFTHAYTSLVFGLYHSFNGEASMHDEVIDMWSLKQMAVGLMRTPSPLSDDGETVGPVFRYLG